MWGKKLPKCTSVISNQLILVPLLQVDIKYRYSKWHYTSKYEVLNLVAIYIIADVDLLKSKLGFYWWLNE